MPKCPVCHEEVDAARLAVCRKYDCPFKINTYDPNEKYEEGDADA